ncbi:MAG: stage IV sporulation protein A [Clostridia bacterium]|nr:stage IV sporulation protein A [Clostridia bacterium]
MDKFDLYRDIATRTGGEVYVGVVGPVRTGKSTFIKEFMSKIALEGIENLDARQRAVDELPQSADGKTIMTTQPKFVPNEAVKVCLGDNINVKLRLVDCVGYMVAGALGGVEDGRERMVRTPWSDDEMPFSKAAEIGTDKVIRDHSTIGVVVTTDGSFTDITRAEYQGAEEKVVEEMKKTGKPFAILLNVKEPKSPSATELKNILETKYNAPVIVTNALNMDEEEIAEIIESILLEFDVKIVDFSLPKWVQALDADNFVVRELLDIAEKYGEVLCKMKDYEKIDKFFDDAEYWDAPTSVSLDAGTGRIAVEVAPKAGVFVKVLNSECGLEIEDDYELYLTINQMAKSREKTARIVEALEQVDRLGYGIVAPDKEDMELKEPEIIRQGQQYGVKLSASAPALHIMKIDVDTEVSPIVGTEQQSEELINSMLGDFGENRQAIWETNIFGRSLSSLVADGINNKLMSVPADAQTKIRRTMGRIVNEGKGGVICILL